MGEWAVGVGVLSECYTAATPTSTDPIGAEGQILRPIAMVVVQGSLTMLCYHTPSAVVPPYSSQSTFEEKQFQ